MSAPMGLAYLGDMKTCTRRTKGLDFINTNPDEWEFLEIETKFKDGPAAVFKHPHVPTGGLAVKLPYGFTGQDTLYFKETFGVIYPNTISWGSGEDDWDYEPEEWAEKLPKEPRYNFTICYRADQPDDIECWRSSMFMPRAYSRFQNIPILNVRVERLQDITEQDAHAEGFIAKTGRVEEETARDAYLKFWDFLNAKRGHPASRNEWVWVYEFPNYSKLKGTVCSQGYDIAKG